MSSHTHQASYQRPRFEVADIFERYFDEYRATHPVSREQEKVVNALRACRTAALGSHVQVCDECGYREYAYNSCRNRHCPRCQYGLKEKWVAERLADLLPIPYYHITFTLTDRLYDLMRCNQAVMYGIFYESAAETLHQFARDARYLGAQIGFIGVLHTWGQTLIYHPHLHFLVTGGGLSFDGRRWVAPRYGERFLFPDRALSQVMRGKFLEKLEGAYEAGRLRLEGPIGHLAEAGAFRDYVRQLARTAFVVKTTSPSGAPERVVGYLGRYTQRVAIANHRIVDIEGGEVCFRYRDNLDGGKEKVMRLGAMEFIRRFLQHVLPRGFKKVRHFGILSGGVKKGKLALARRLLAAVSGQVGEVVSRAAGRLEAFLPRCPRCRVGRLRFGGFVGRAPFHRWRPFGVGGRWLLDGL